MAYNIKAAIRAAKNMQYEPIEVKVRDATNNDAWGVSTSALADIARSTHHHDEYALLFKMVWKRLTDVDHVMHVQKALILTDYLLRNGAERFINDAKRRARDISALQKYKQYDANNRDVGGDVRAKAKNVYELLTNDSKLAEERAKAQAIRDVKLSGLGNDGYGHGDADGDRDTHRDRFVDGEGGAESPRTDDWEKENHAGDGGDGGDDDVPEYDPTRKSRKDADTEASADDKRREEKKKKKKEKKEKADATEAAAEEEPAPEEGEKKKKKKKKKSNADASEASFDDSAAATTTAASTAPSSAITSTASTPAFSASSATLDSFDAFAPSSQATNGAADFGSFGAQPAAASAASVAAPGEADKPKKSRKGKKGAAEAAAAPAAASSAAPPSVSVGGDYDLTNFATIATPRGPGSSDIDILTGTNAPAGRLEDMFAANSLMDEPLDANGEEDDGFAVEEEPALLDMLSTNTAAGQMVSPRGSGGMTSAEEEPAKPKDVWDLAADFTNIDNLKGSVAKKKTNQREEVSMSMMRGMQPFGGSGQSMSVSAASALPQQAAASPFFGGPGAGANVFGGLPGMGGAPQFAASPMHHGGGMHGGGHMGHPAASPYGGGMGGGMPGGFGGPPAGGMGGYGGGGMGGGMAGMGGGMGGGMPGGFPGGFPGMGASAPPTNDLPFAAAPTAIGSRTKMPANGKPLVFDAVPAASRQSGGQQAMAPSAHGPAGPNWNR